MVVDASMYDWEDDRPPRRPFAKSVLYEMHVGAFTRHPSSGIPAGKRGTYAGVIEKIPYLQNLGVSAVELLPVFTFDEQDAPPGLVNDWGYSLLSFFAPHQAYSSRPDALGTLDEFRDMVKPLHRCTAPASRSSSTSYTITLPRVTRRVRPSASAADAERLRGVPGRRHALGGVA